MRLRMIHLNFYRGKQVAAMQTAKGIASRAANNKVGLGVVSALVLAVIPAVAAQQNIKNQTNKNEVGAVTVPEDQSTESAPSLLDNASPNDESSNNETKSEDSNQSGNEVHIKIESHSSSSSSSNHSEGTEQENESSVKINGQEIEVPEDGNVRKRIKSSDGSSSMKIYFDSSSSVEQSTD